jgi:antirestriction protein ArdC
MMSRGYEYPLYVGFAQAKELGWIVKGKATWIFFGGTGKKQIEDEETKELKDVFYRMHKWQSVFNVAYIDDSNSDHKVADYVAKFKPVKNKPVESIKAADDFVKAQKSVITFGGDVAAYSPSLDKIMMPVVDDFLSTEGYYSTLFHEHIHWTGHTSRLNREMSTQFGSPKYAFEELIAELGASFICNEMGIEQSLEHHASYIKSWQKSLKESDKAFFKALSAAQQAADMLLENAGMKVEIESKELVAV